MRSEGTTGEADRRDGESAGAPAGGAVVRIGPAGWSYADWDGIVYPSPRPRGWHPLDLLVRLFPTIEVNATFYRDVPARQLESWCRQVEWRPDFRWCFKLHRSLSHAGAPPPADALRRALEAYAPVREAGRLGAILLQFPWSLRPTDANAAALSALSAAARDDGWPLVIEVRHAGWSAVAQLAPVVCDQPPLRSNLEVEDALRAALAHPSAGDPLYFRLHGRNRAAWFDPDAGRDARYDYLYGPEEMREWRDRLGRAAATVARATAGASVFVITNNHYQGQAAVNALELQRLWDGTAPAVPESLARAFPRELSGFPLATPTAADGTPLAPPGPAAEPAPGPGADPAGRPPRRRKKRGRDEGPTLF